MWVYEKKLEFPVKIKQKNPALAKLILTQYGGPDGELGASLRYLSQRFTMITPDSKAALTDIGTEELAHLEMIGSIVFQLSDDIDPACIKKAGFDTYYVDHGTGVYPSSAAGIPWSAMTIQVKGDPRTDLYEDLAAEQKARSTYEYLLNLTDDPDVIAPLRFLREREIVHFQRFGECLENLEDYLSHNHTFVMPKNNLFKNYDKSYSDNIMNNNNNNCNKKQNNSTNNHNNNCNNCISPRNNNCLNNYPKK